MILSDIILASMPLNMREQLKADIMSGRVSDSDPRLANVPQVFALAGPDRCETVEDSLNMVVGMNTLTVIACRAPADAKVWAKRATLAVPMISSEAAEAIGRECDSPDLITGFIDVAQERAKKILNVISFGLTNLTPDQKFDTDKPYEIATFGSQMIVLNKRFRMSSAGLEGLLTGFRPSGIGMGDPEGDPEMALADAYDSAIGASTGPFKESEVGGPLLTFIRGQRGMNKGKNEMMQNIYAQIQKTFSDPDFVKNLFSNVQKAVDTGSSAVATVKEARVGGDQINGVMGDPVIPDMYPLTYAEVGDAFGTLRELNEIIEGDPEVGGPLMKRLKAKGQLRRFLATQRALAKVRAKHRKKSERRGLTDEDFDTRSTFGSKGGRFQADNLAEDEAPSGGGLEDEFDGSSSSDDGSEMY